MSHHSSFITHLSKFSEAALEAVITRLEAYSAADLYESNKVCAKLASDRFQLHDAKPLAEKAFA